MADKVSVVIEVDSRGAVTAFKSAGDGARSFGDQLKVADAAAKSHAGVLDTLANKLGMSKTGVLGLASAMATGVAGYVAATGALNSFFSVVDRAGALADMSQKIGVNAASLSQFKLAAEASGTSIEGLATGFKFLSKNLTEAATGGNDAAKAMAAGFKVLGVDATSAVNDTNGALMQLADQFAAMPDSAEKTTLAMKIFGRAGLDLIPFLNQGSEGIRKMTELNDALGLSMTGETISALDNFGDNLAALGQVGQGVWTQLAAGAAPVLDALVSQLLEVAKSFGISNGTIKEWGLSVAQTIAGAVAKALRYLADFVTNVQNIGLKGAIYSVFADAFDTAVALAKAAGLRIASALFTSIASSLSKAQGIFGQLFDFAAGEAAANLGTALGDEANQQMKAIGESAASASPALSGFANALNTAADAADKLSGSGEGLRQNYVETGAAAEGAAEGAEKNATATGKAAEANIAFGGSSDEAKKAADEAAAATDKYNGALASLSDEGAKAISAITPAWMEATQGALSYTQAVLNVQAVDASGDYWQDLTVRVEAYNEVLMKMTAELASSAAQTKQSNDETEAQIAAITAATAAGKDYEAAQHDAAVAVVEFNADQKAQAGIAVEVVAAWREQQLRGIELADTLKRVAQASKDAAEIRDLQSQVTVWGQVKAGVISVSEAEKQLAVNAKVAAGSSRENAEAIVDLADKVKTAQEEAQTAWLNMGDVIRGAFDQTFDAIIGGTRNLGDALEGIGLSIGKQIFSAMLDAKFGKFDPTVKANFLELGDFGTSTFGGMFEKVSEIGKKAFRAIGIDIGSGPGGAGGQGEPIGQNDDGSFMYADKGSSSGGGGWGSFFGTLTQGMGIGMFTKSIADSVLGSTTSGSEGWDSALSAFTGVASGLANLIPGIGPLVSALTGIIGNQLPRLIGMLLDTRTEGTKQRQKGESYLDKSETFSALQDKSKLGDFTRDASLESGVFKNYQTGVETAVKRGMAAGEAAALKGGGEGLFAVLFKNDGDKMVNGAMDMGRGLAEFFSRGLKDGMTYDEMIASLRSFAEENEITFDDALRAVQNFGTEAIKQFDKVGHPEWGAEEFADSLIGVTEIFKGDFPAGVNLASIALQSMQKDGESAFSSLDGVTKDWIQSVTMDADSLRTLLADLAAKGFTINMDDFKNTLEDIKASATFVGDSLGGLFDSFQNTGSFADGLKSMGKSLADTVVAGFKEVSVGDLFDTTRIAESFQGLFENLRMLKSGDMSGEDFMSNLAGAVAEGRANLEEYMPRIKAMAEAFKEVRAAVEAAFEPSAAEKFAAAVEDAAKSLQDNFKTGLGDALNAALSEGGTRADGIKAFADSMRGSIKDSIKESIVQGMVEAAVMKGPLAEMMATFGEAFKGAVQGGISKDEQAMLTAYLGQVGKMADGTIALLQPSVDAVLALGEAADSTFGSLSNGPTTPVPTDPALEQFKANVEEAKTTLKEGFSSAVSEAFSTLGQGGSIADATAAFSESFKSSISQSITAGLQEALVNSAVMEGALGTMMANFKTATADAMADGVITASEQANLSAMVTQIKTAGESAANALAPVVASVAGIATGVDAGVGTVSYNVQAQTTAVAQQADTTVAQSVSTAAETVSSAVAAAGEATASGIDAASTAATGIADSAALASDALSTAGDSLTTDLTAATQSISTSLQSILGTGDSISTLAPQAAMGIGESLATVRDTVGPEMQSQIDGIIKSLSDASVSPDEAAAIKETFSSLSDLDPAMTKGIADTMKALGEAALSSSDTANLTGTLKAFGEAALSGSQADAMKATLSAFADASTEGAANTTAVVAAFGSIDPSTSADISAALGNIVSGGVVEGTNALAASLGNGNPDQIVAGLQTLQTELDQGALDGLTQPLGNALDAMRSPVNDAANAADDMASTFQSVVDRFNSAASEINHISTGGTPAAATGGTFGSGSAVVGEGGSPELVTALPGGGFQVTPLSWRAANALMKGGTRGLAVGGVVGGGGFGGGGGIPPAPPPRPTYVPGAEGAEYADFTGAITSAFKAAFESGGDFLKDFSDAMEESVRTSLLTAIEKGFSEGGAVQENAKAIDSLVTQAQFLAGNGKLTSEALADIQAKIKTNTDAIAAQADVLDDVLGPLRQAEAISKAISGGLNFSSALQSLAKAPEDLDAFGKNIDQIVSDSVLNGAIEGLLASGPIADAVKAFGDTMNSAMADALQDGVLTAEESGALREMAVSGSEEMKTAMAALGPVLAALGINVADPLKQASDTVRTMLGNAVRDSFKPGASFNDFAQNMRNEVYTNIKDGLVQSFIDTAVMNGLLSGPMAAIQDIFTKIGAGQMSVAEANKALLEQTTAINSALNDPAFKSAWDTTMGAITSIGNSLGQTVDKAQEATSAATDAIDTSAAVEAAKIELEARTRALGNAALDSNGSRQGDITVEDFVEKINRSVPKFGVGGTVRKSTLALIGEAGPEAVVPLGGTGDSIEDILGAITLSAGMKSGGNLTADLGAAVRNVANAATISGAPANADMADMAEKLAQAQKAAGDDNVSAIKDLGDAMSQIAKALEAQPAQTDIKIDGEVLVRAISKAKRLAKKAGVNL